MNQPSEWEGSPFPLCIKARGRSQALKDRTSSLHGLQLLCSTHAPLPCSGNVPASPHAPSLCHCPVSCFCHNSTLCLVSGRHSVQSPANSGGKSPVHVTDNASYVYPHWVDETRCIYHRAWLVGFGFFRPSKIIKVSFFLSDIPPPAPLFMAGSESFFLFERRHNFQ